MTKYLPFYLDNCSFYTNQKCFIIVGDNLGFLTAFLNSNLFKFCYRESFPQLQGGTRELSKIFFEKVKVPIISKKENDIFEKKVQEIQKKQLNNEDSENLEIEINEMILNLYPLNKEEKDLIKSFSI